MTVSQAEFARRIGKSKQYVNKLVKQGKISVDAAGRIDADLAARQLAAIADPARRLGGADSAPDGMAVDPADGANGVRDDEIDEMPGARGGAGAPVEMSAFQKARTVRETFQAREAQRKYETSIGRLIDRASTEDAFREFGISVRQGLADRAAELAVVVAGLGGDTDRIAAAIDAADRAALASLADMFEQRFGAGDAIDAA